MGLCVVWNGSIWVVIGNGAHSIAWSKDGKKWVGVEGSSDIFETAFNLFWNGNIWVAIGINSNHSIAWSDDGKNWTGVVGSNKLILFEFINFFPKSNIGFLNGIWVIGGSKNEDESGNLIVYSEDGKNWNGVVNLPNSLSFVNSIVTNGKLWVAGGVAIKQRGLEKDTEEYPFLYSKNGKDWEKSSMISIKSEPVNYKSFEIKSISTNGNMWFATGSYYNRKPLDVSSIDGINWTSVDVDKFRDIGSFEAMYRYSKSTGNMFILSGIAKKDTKNYFGYSYDANTWKFPSPEDGYTNLTINNIQFDKK